MTRTAAAGRAWGVRPTLILAGLFALSGCSAMMLGDAGTAGPPIGADTRSAPAAASDRSITAAILGRYAASEGLSGRGLRVDTRRGVVTLRGSVDSYGLRDEAFRLASDVAGVVRVDNQIAIRR